MEKLELLGEIDSQGRMVFEHLPLPAGKSSRVKVTIEYVNVVHPSTESDDTSIDLDDTPEKEVLDSLRRSMQQVNAGDRVPISEIWEILAENDDS